MEGPSSFCRAPRFLGARGNVLADLKKDARHARQRDAVIDFNVFEGARRHGRAQRVAWVLNDRYTAPALDFVEPGGAVVEPPGQDDADRVRSISARCAAKQRVDRRPGPVHARSAGEHQVAAAKEKMMVRWRDIDFASEDQLTVAGMMCRQEGAAVQDLWKLARMGADMENCQERCRDLRGQICKQLLHRLDPSVGGADNHDCETAGPDFSFHAALTSTAGGPVPKCGRTETARPKHSYANAN